jgi:hypothetical protein
MHRRSTLLAILLSLLFAVSVVSPANASPTGWDPDDVRTRLDLRWIGVYRQDPDTVRVSITLWDPVRDWMLSGRDWMHSGDLLGKRQLYIVATNPPPASGIYGQGYIHSVDNDWWVGWVDSGSGQPFSHPFRAVHPNAYTFLVFLPVEVFSDAEFSVFSCESPKAFENVPCYDYQGIHDQIDAN